MPVNPKASTPWPTHHWVRIEAVPARLARLSRDNRDEQGAHQQPGIDILVLKVNVPCPQSMSEQIRLVRKVLIFCPKVLALNFPPAGHYAASRPQSGP